MTIRPPVVGFSSVFALHDAGPVGALGLVSFAAAAALIDRSRTGDARANSVRSAGVVVALSAS